MGKRPRPGDQGSLDRNLLGAHHHCQSHTETQVGYSCSGVCSKCQEKAVQAGLFLHKCCLHIRRP